MNKLEKIQELQRGIEWHNVIIKRYKGYLKFIEEADQDVIHSINELINEYVFDNYNLKKELECIIDSEIYDVELLNFLPMN